MISKKNTNTINFKTNIEFIKIIEEYPVLYDRKHAHYGIPIYKNHAWYKVAVKVEKTIGASKLKWYRLRQSYARAIRTRQKFCYKKHLKFLKPHMMRIIQNKALPKLKSKEKQKIVHEFYTNLKYDEQKFKDLDAGNRMLLALKIRGIVKKLYSHQSN